MPISVAVVGGGMAGLCAAAYLAPTHPDIVLLEASPTLGGRVRSADGLAPWPVELGAEFVHGAKSQLKALLADMGCSLKEYDWPDRWWFAAEGGGLVGPDLKDVDVDRVTQLLSSVGDLVPPPAGQDISVESWLASQGVSERGLAVADACFANDFGCALADLGLTEAIAENAAWDAGDTYLVPDRPFSDAVAHLAARLPRHSVRTGWPVTRVRLLRSGAVQLTGPDQQTLVTRRVIITVPLAILQADAIRFDPPLPTAKHNALVRVRVGNAVKAVLAFSSAFWPPDFFDVVCPGAFVPEFWVNSGRAPRGVAGPRGATASLTAFLAGRRADEAGRLGEQEVVRRCLNQLDAMFGTPANPGPATAAFISAAVADWSKDPHVRGGYSYPSLGAHPTDRAALAAPVGDSLFFAGEATHPAVNPCVQAALETGERAAREVVAAEEAERVAPRL